MTETNIHNKDQIVKSYNAVKLHQLKRLNRKLSEVKNCLGILKCLESQLSTLNIKTISNFTQYYDLYDIPDTSINHLDPDTNKNNIILKNQTTLTHLVSTINIMISEIDNITTSLLY